MNRITSRNRASEIGAPFEYLFFIPNKVVIPHQLHKTLNNILGDLWWRNKKKVKTFRLEIIEQHLFYRRTSYYFLISKKTFEVISIDWERKTQHVGEFKYRDHPL